MTLGTVVHLGALNQAMNRILTLLSVLVALLTLSVAQAQFPGSGPERMKWTAAAEGGELILKGEIEKGWHLYSTIPVKDGPFPTTIEAKGITLGKRIVELTPKKKFDPNFEVDVQTFDEKAEIRIPITAKSGDSATVDVTYQLCSDRTCLNPRTKTLTVDVSKVTPGAAPAAVGAKTPDDSASAKITPVKKDYGGLIAFFGTAIAAGFFALVTPCVFPMIPITVSIFSKHGEGSAVKPAIAFCLGIISTFTILGVGVSLLFGATGLQNLANDPWLNLGMGILFVVLAFSLFGAFEIGVPASWANKLNSKKRSGLAGPIVMGLVFSLTSFTCTMPFVGTLLVTAAQGDVLYPIVGMLGFSSAFSLPFFGLALFPRAVSKLPKSGGWLSTVKAFMGFVELIAAIKFFSTVDLAWQLGWLTKEVYLTLWFGIMLLAGLFLLGWIRIPTVHDESKPGIPRIGAALASIAASVWFLTALNGNSLQDLEAFVPPDPYPYKTVAGAVAKTSEEGWIASYDLAVEEAKKTGKPIFIDFTGIYCSNCRYMEKNVLNKPAVEEELKNFVLAKLYTDRRDNPEDQRYQKLKIDLTGSASNPVYAVVNAEGKLLASSEYDRDVQRFANFMKSGREKLVSLR